VGDEVTLDEVLRVTHALLALSRQLVELQERLAVFYETDAVDLDFENWMKDSWQAGG